MLASLAHIIPPTGLIDCRIETTGNESERGRIVSGQQIQRESAHDG